MGTDLNINTYIEEALKDQPFRIREITLVGTGEKADGYASEFTFATVSATTEEGVEKTIEIAVKCSKKLFLQTNRTAYEREAYFYKTILPEFTRFQIQNNIGNVFDSVPKCYKTISDENAEVLVMENLRKNGYFMYDRMKPLDLNHLKLVLREYGKFHAISFALRNKNKDVFERLVNNFDDVMIGFINESYKKAIQQGLERTCGILKEMGYTKLYEMCTKILQKGADVVTIEMLKTVEPESAILHGDCWNNNFIYKYEDEGHIIPSKVAIIDWQISRLHSPVMDLASFIYTTSSDEQLKHFDELLDTYYTSFSKYLTDFGCDPEELFPFSVLQRHWKKYSLYGMLLVTGFLHIVICDKEDAPELENAEEIGDKLLNVAIKDEVAYRKRILAVVSHYFTTNFTK